MPRTRPWTPCRPIWTVLPPQERAAAREDFVERAAIMEYDGGNSRGTAELAAYAFLVERLHREGKIPVHRILLVVLSGSMENRKKWGRWTNISRYCCCRPIS